MDIYAHADKTILLTVGIHHKIPDSDCKPDYSLNTIKYSQI